LAYFEIGEPHQASGDGNSKYGESVRDSFAILSGTR
jgi:hypothetical protein